MIERLRIFPLSAALEISSVQPLDLEEHYLHQSHAGDFATNV